MRYAIGLGFIALTIWLLQATGLLMTIAVFLMVGAVPGTTISVSPQQMGILLAVLGALVALWLLRMQPVRQIKSLKQTYHNQPVAEQPAPAVAAPKVKVKQKKEPVFALGYHQSFSAWRERTVVFRHRLERTTLSQVRTFIVYAYDTAERTWLWFRA